MPKIFTFPDLNAKYGWEIVSASVLQCGKQEKKKLKLKSDVEFPIILCDINASFGNKEPVVSL